MGASSVIGLVRKLATESTSTSDEDRAEILAMLTEARAALVQRNKILHASVGELMLEGKSIFHRRKKGNRAGWTEFGLGIDLAWSR